ncbi:unnamed protein product [Gongylonema pulchrum]|uniref:Conserved oligomeric Golgi complex subunit 8 n=1 Tax=Gongylonema pulchrum TaxID=637853 RepID=A0A183D7J4_9BILA|nr:unnamed protein product [Gongylonema pulchrum]
MQAQLDLCQQSCPKSTSKRDNVDPKETEASGDLDSELTKTKDSATSRGFDVTEQDDIYAQCAGLANFIELPFLKQIRRECLSLMENAENRETRIIGLLAYQRLEQLLCAAGYKQNMNRLKFEQSIDSFCDFNLRKIAPLCRAIAARHCILLFNKVSIFTHTGRRVVPTRNF